MIAIALIVAFTTAETSTAGSGEWWRDAGLLGFFCAAVGVIGTIITTKTLEATKKEQSQAAIEAQRMRATYAEIERLRGNQNLLFQRLQNQISEQDEKIDDLENWADRLLDHIRKGLGWPPPPRPKISKRKTEPIDLSAQPPMTSIEELTKVIHSEDE